jgi:hypothetical protein
MVVVEGKLKKNGPDKCGAKADIQTREKYTLKR